MKKLAFGILIVSIFFLAFMPTASAGSVYTIKNAVNKGGSIGLYITNELGVLLQTDSAKYSTNVLAFFVNGTSAAVDMEKTVSSLPRGTETLVVLKHPYPTSGYYIVNSTYTDSSGGLYPVETFIVFAKPPITVKKTETIPPRVFPNSSFDFKIILEASPQDKLSNMRTENLANPKFFTLDKMDTLATVQAGQEGTFSFKFKPSGEIMESTIVYSTSYFPIRLTFQHLGHETTAIVNESFVVFNPSSVPTLLPKLEAKIEMPSDVEPGVSTDVPVYVWNSNVGAHKACNLNLTMEASNPEIKIPVNSIISADEFAGRVEVYDEPTATFTIETANSTTLKDYTLTLTARFKDCEWKLDDKITKSVSFSVKTAEQIAEEGAELPPIKAPEVPNEPLVNITLPTTDNEEGKLPSSFIIIVAIIGIISLFGVIYYLEMRSRTIF